MRIVHQSVLNVYSHPPEVPLLAAPCIAGLLPAQISTPQMTVLKRLILFKMNFQMVSHVGNLTFSDLTPLNREILSDLA